jgi:LEA14-like dessication related protein
MKRTFRLNSLARTATVAAVVVTSFTAAACSHAFREPTVRLADIVSGGFGLKGGSVIAQIEVDNPNSFTLGTKTISYNFEVLDATKSDTSWVPVTKGIIDKPIRVGSNDKTIVEVPIDFNYSDFGPVARSVMDRGSFRYRVSGTVELKDPISRTIPFHRTDTFRVAGIR